MADQPTFKKKIKPVVHRTRYVTDKHIVLYCAEEKFDVANITAYDDKTTCPDCISKIKFRNEKGATILL